MSLSDFRGPQFLNPRLLVRRRNAYETLKANEATSGYSSLEARTYLDIVANSGSPVLEAEDHRRGLVFYIQKKKKKKKKHEGLW